MLTRAHLRWLQGPAAAWAMALAAAALALVGAWRSFDNAQTGQNRPDGNCGHATIDFGGQWIMGRMIVTGHGRDLYNRNTQRLVLRDAYPETDHETGKGDVENLMYWMMGQDDARSSESVASTAAALAAAGPLHQAALLTAVRQECPEDRLRQALAKQVGGPLYPPVNAVLIAPLGLLPPRAAYRAQQAFNLLLAFTAGLAIHLLARGRVWWPIAALGVMTFPGFAGSIDLGQNATLTLNILCWGWLLVDRGRPGWGGAVWGLLAFKPVWAAAFFLVPLLTRRYRMAAAMALAGAALAALTLPVVGLETWRDWLHIGRDAAELYNVERNWISLSRDLLGIPRRWMLDFEIPSLAERDRPAAALVGYGLLAMVAEATLRTLVLRRRPPATEGPGAAYVLLAAWMSCFHFMYYDVLLAALPAWLLFTHPRRYMAPLLLALAPLRRRDLPPAVLDHFAPTPLKTASVADPAAAPVRLSPRQLLLLNRFFPTLYALLLATQFVFPLLNLGSYWGPPWDTFCLIALWFWCGWQWLCHGDDVATDWPDA